MIRCSSGDILMRIDVGHMEPESERGVPNTSARTCFVRLGFERGLLPPPPFAPAEPKRKVPKKVFSRVSFADFVATSTAFRGTK